MVIFFATGGIKVHYIDVKNFNKKANLFNNNLKKQNLTQSNNILIPNRSFAKLYVENHNLMRQVKKI